MPTNISYQGRIQDLKKEGAQGNRGRIFLHILANLGGFLKNLAQKRVGVRPPSPLWIRAWLFHPLTPLHTLASNYVGPMVEKNWGPLNIYLQHVLQRIIYFIKIQSQNINFKNTSPPGDWIVAPLWPITECPALLLFVLSKTT